MTRLNASEKPETGDPLRGELSHPGCLLFLQLSWKFLVKGLNKWSETREFRERNKCGEIMIHDLDSYVSWY